MSEQAQDLGKKEHRSASMPEVFRLIELANKRLKQIQRETIKGADLTPSQYFVLTLLWGKDGRPFKELAAAAHSSPATVTGIVDTLERKDLVSREPNPDDRRSLLVKLTDKGHSLQDSTPTLDGIFRSCCAGLEPDEIQQLSRLLRKLNESLSY